MINRKIFFQGYKESLDKNKSLSSQEVKDIDILFKDYCDDLFGI